MATTKRIGTLIVTAGPGEQRRDVEVPSKMTCPDGYHFVGDTGTVRSDRKKLRGKAAVKAAKRERQRLRRHGVKLLVLR